MVRDEKEAAEGEQKQREFVRGLNKYAEVAEQKIDKSLNERV